MRSYGPVVARAPLVQRLVRRGQLRLETAMDHYRSLSRRSRPASDAAFASKTPRHLDSE